VSTPTVTNVTAVPQKDFVHLHVHTDRSLLDGCCRVDRLVERAAALGMTSLAITDHGNLFGAIDFYNEAKARNIKPIIGCEIYLVDGSRLEKHGRADWETLAKYSNGLKANGLDCFENRATLSA